MPNPANTFAITYRTLSAGPLTNAQVDANFQALQDYALHLSGGTMTGPLNGTSANYSGNVSCATPTQPGHAATKNYVDSTFLPINTPNISNAQIAADAAIAYNKLNLTGSIANADIAAAAAIAYTKLNLTGAIKNADIAADAAIADTKLGTIQTAGKVANSATTAVSANTASAIVARDGSGGFNAGNVQLTGVGIGTAPVNNEVRATGEITAYYSSDAALKNNVTPLVAALARVKEIRGVSFDWSDKYIAARGGEDGYFVRKQDVGVIAQEVQKVLPHAVASREDGYLAVRYEKIIPLLIEAIKELSDKLDARTN
jgi:hypothetical protein